MAQYGAKELANSFRTVRGNTLQIAREIPEESYDFVAADGVRSVSQLLRHIAYVDILYYDFHRDRHIETLKGYDFGALIVRSTAEEVKPLDKDGIIALLEERGQAFASWEESLSPEFLAETFTDHMGQNPKTRLEHLMSAKEHEMHHRGQLMLIQRLIGITPHLTRQREERARARAATMAAR
ncbi:MAG TPA: DinB family protein [Gemmatimonadaceae bacterium]|jgi:uncharacterized damage-inducible protein DinB|nr:DinB family protein [Gemmatimonadaceae bacterium]